MKKVFIKSFKILKYTLGILFYVPIGFAAIYSAIVYLWQFILMKIEKKWDITKKIISQSVFSINQNLFQRFKILLEKKDLICAAFKKYYYSAHWKCDIFRVGNDWKKSLLRFHFNLFLPKQWENIGKTIFVQIRRMMSDISQLFFEMEYRTGQAKVGALLLANSFTAKGATKPRSRLFWTFTNRTPFPFWHFRFRVKIVFFFLAENLPDVHSQSIAQNCEKKWKTILRGLQFYNYYLQVFILIA